MQYFIMASFQNIYVNKSANSVINLTTKMLQLTFI